MRYNTDGSLDTSFSDDGKVATRIGSWYSSAGALAFQPDGKIIAAGSAIGNEASSDDSNYDFLLTRYNTDGTLDTSFDGDGKLTTPVGQYNAGVKALSVQPNGSITAVGYRSGLAIVHYNSDGSLDTTFGDGGKRVTPTGSDGVIGLEDYLFQPDGKILVVGTFFGQDIYGKGYNYDFGLARYNADGSPDTTFSDDGKQSTEFGTYTDQGKALALQSDGKIVAAGWTYDNATSGNSKSLRQ